MVGTSLKATMKIRLILWGNIADAMLKSISSCMSMALIEVVQHICDIERKDAVTPAILNAAVLHYGTTKIRQTYEQPCAVGQKSEPAGMVATATLGVARGNS
jgi:hypothetical protein